MLPLYAGNVERPKDRASFTVEDGGRLFATTTRYWDRDWILGHTKGGQTRLVKVPTTGHRLCEVIVVR